MKGNKTHHKLNGLLLFCLLWSITPVQGRTPGLYKSENHSPRQTGGVIHPENSSVADMPSILGRNSSPSGIFSSEKSALAATPGGDGPALGTPVGDTSLLLAAIAVLYGIMIKLKNVRLLKKENDESNQ